MTDTLPPPHSATNTLINCTGLVGFAAVLWACREYGIRGIDAGLLAVACYAVPVLLLEVIFLRTPWNASVGIDFSQKNTDLPRLAVKMIGMYGSFGFVAALYWVFPEYHGSYYNVYWDALHELLPYVFLLAVPYTVFMDERMKDPFDSYYWFGKCLLLDFKGVKRIIIVQHLLGWVVKGFFLPLMFVGFVGNMNHLGSVSLDNLFDDFPTFFRLSLDLLYTVDLLAAVAGYSLAIRIFDTHLRSSEPTLFGWIICVVCYQPFQSVVMAYYLAYSSNSWLDWLKDTPTLQALWGSAALLLISIYTYATVNFGCRFSNLTHRGLITGGLYRFTKHPAYVTKNIFWWMLHVPFVPTQGALEAFRYCLLLLGVNGVYYLRARTEERHLSFDPGYVRYALWMNEKSIFAPLARRLPFLQYKAPAGWEARPEPYMGMK